MCSSWDFSQFEQYANGSPDISPFDFLSGYIDTSTTYTQLRKCFQSLSENRIKEFIALCITISSFLTNYPDEHLMPQTIFQVLGDIRSEFNHYALAE